MMGTSFFGVRSSIFKHAKIGIIEHCEKFSLKPVEWVGSALEDLHG